MKEKDFIERLVELAEGFFIYRGDYTPHGNKASIKYNVLFVEHEDSWSTTEHIREWRLYPLLLYRAMEGWNRKVVNAQTGEAMWLQPEAVFAFLGDDEVNIEYSDYQSIKYLTPQEQALEDALKEVLEDEYK